MTTLQTDYLIIGSGAMGMAFADSLMTETDASLLLVDRHHQPGGHWNDAYPHVRLHQPSAFYGVNSKALGFDRIEPSGFNEGLYELATNSEVCAYFHQVMQQQFLPSGRVQYFPMCDYRGDSEFESLVSGQSYSVDAQHIVDATYMNVVVPSKRPPPYDVADGMHCVAPNALPALTGQFQRYVVIGAGKTGMDACLFLLQNGVDAQRIAWVMPRDSWMLDRANIQPGELFSSSIARGFALQNQAMAAATDVDDLLSKVADCGQLLRFDDDVWPTMYRCATVTRSELAALRQINNVIRMGHVQRIEADRMVLEGGDQATDSQTLHIDCTADGLAQRPAKPVFDGQHITLQSVRTCQQVFSAAFIGHIEAAYEDETAKNELCTPVPHPDSAIDFLRTSLANTLNTARWSADDGLQEWLAEARLDAFTPTRSRREERAADDALQALRESAEAAAINLMRILGEVDQT